MAYIESMECCAIREIARLESNPVTVITSTMRHTEDDGDQVPAFFTFSDTSRSRAGKNLAKYIKSSRLGSALKTRSKRNPNTSNRVTVWVWSIDRPRLQRWWKKNKPKETEGDTNNDFY